MFDVVSAAVSFTTPAGVDTVVDKLGGGWIRLNTFENGNAVVVVPEMVVEVGKMLEGATRVVLAGKLEGAGALLAAESKQLV